MIRGALIFILFLVLYGLVGRQDHHDEVEQHKMIVSLYPEAAESIEW